MIEDFVLSFTNHYGFCPGNVGSAKTLELSKKALHIIAAFVEYRLRLLLREILKLSKKSIFSCLNQRCVTLRNVMAASSILQIDMLEYLQQLSAHYIVSSTEACMMPAVDMEKLYPTISCFPIDIVLAILNAKKETPKVNSTKISTSLSSSHQLGNESVTDLLFKVSIQWIILDGRATLLLPQFKKKSMTASCPGQLVRIMLQVPFEHKFCASNIQENLDTKSYIRDLCSLGVITQIKEINHVLSREHLLLLRRIREVLATSFARSGKKLENKLQLILNTLQKSSGLNQLMPYLVYFFVNQLYSALSHSSPYKRPASGIQNTISAVVALFHNPALEAVHWIHQAIQALLFVVLHPCLEIVVESLTKASVLRYLAAKAISNIAHKHSARDGGQLINLVSNSYSCALVDLQQPIPTILGAVIGIRMLSVQAIHNIVFPLLPLFIKLIEYFNLEAVRHKLDNSETIHKLKIDLSLELLGCICDGLRNGLSFHTDHFSNISESLISQLEKLLGDRLLPPVLASLSICLSRDMQPFMKSSL